MDYIFKNCNSGMEKIYNDSLYIIKNPTIVEDIDTIVEDPAVRIKTVIFPIRDYKESAQSRVRHGYECGGLWGGTDEPSQIEFYEKIVSNYLECMKKYNIHTIFLDFTMMTTDKLYLFDALQPILQEKDIQFDFFSQMYDEVSITSTPLK
jgi:hypothetical protein